MNNFKRNIFLIGKKSETCQAMEMKIWNVYFSVIQTGPGAHPASCTMGTVSFPGVKSGQGVTLPPHPF